MLVHVKDSLFKVMVFLAVVISYSSQVYAQSMVLSTSSQDYEVSTVFSDVRVFEFSIEIDEPLATGVYVNPAITSVTYRVVGDLADGTPSGFMSFALEREIAGEDFYAQGSMLQFEISPSAVLDDGVQVAELAGGDLVFRFDGRELGNGRFHPALFELRADGTGRIQNSNNVPTLDPLLEIATGLEYVTDLTFDAGNTTLITESMNSAVSDSSLSGGGGLGLIGLCVLCLCGAARKLRRQLISCYRNAASLHQRHY